MNRFNHILLFSLMLTIMACAPTADKEKADGPEAATSERTEELTTPATTPKAVSKIQAGGSEQAVSTERPAVTRPQKEEAKTRTLADNDRKPAGKATVSTSTPEQKKQEEPPLKASSSISSEKEGESQKLIPAKTPEQQATANTTNEPAPTPEPEETAAAKPDHSAWDKLLQKHVTAGGKVNYKDFQSDLNALQAYLEDLAEHPVQPDWAKGEKMAYWINAYNAFTIKLILDHYPVKSIKDLDNGNPWDVKWIELGDKTYSLNNIENDILRPQFRDPRIHFAVNCAAKSCPPLLNRAWTADKLNQYFEQQTKAFINNSRFNQLSAKQATISRIFEWYKDDFGNVIDFLNKYANTGIHADAKIGYMEYDWGLNN